MKHGLLILLAVSCLIGHTSALELRVSRGLNQVNLLWEAERGRSYHIESASSMPGPWQKRTEVKAETSPAEWQDKETGSAHQCFYRLTLLSTKLIASDRESASSEQIWNNNAVHAGGVTLQWVNTRRQNSFKNGKLSSLDTYWQASGEVLRDGAPYGAYKMESNSTLFVVKFLLVTPGEAIELASYQIMP